MSKKDDNISFNSYLLKQFLSAYKANKQFYWSEDEFEYLLRYCFDNNKLPMLHYAVTLALKYYPENADFHYYSGKYYMLTDKLPKALMHFKKFLFDDPENDFIVFEMCFCWEVIDDDEDAKKVLSEYLDKFNPSSAAAWFALGTVYIKRDEVDNAIDAFEFSIALNPESIATYYNLGNLYCIKQMYDKAYLVYYEALKYDDEDAGIYANLAECCFYLDDCEKVIEYGNKAISLDDATEYAYYFLAKVYLKDEKLKLASDFTEKAIKLNDQISEFFSLKGYVEVCLENMEAAEDAFANAIKLDPTLFDCYFDIAIFYSQIDRHSDAIDILESNLAFFSDEDKIVAKYLLSACNYMLGRKQEAYAQFLDIENINPELFDFLYENFSEFIGDQIIADFISEMQS